MPRFSSAMSAVVAAVLLTAPLREARAQSPISVILAAGDISSCLPPLPPGAVPTKEQTRERAIRSGNATADLIIEQIRKIKLANPRPPVAVLGLGDLAYNCGTNEAFKCFEESWGRIKKELAAEAGDRFLLVPGNHEYSAKRMENGNEICIREKDAKKGEKHAQPFFAYYKAELEQLGASNGSYSLDFPSGTGDAWHLIAINPYGEGPPPKWLEDALKKSAAKKCVLAFTHPFYYSSGHHGHNDAEDLGAAKQPLRSMRKTFRLLHAHRVSVLLAGHDHHFEQLGRANANGSADLKKGLRSFVVGTGGKKLYSDIYTDKWRYSEAIDLQNYGILRIDLHANRYEWEFIPVQPAAPSMSVKKNVRSDNCNRP